MKNLILTIVVSLASTFVMAFTMATRMKVNPIEEPPSRPLALEVITPKVEAPKVELIVKNHDKFLEDLGFRESSGNYKAVNKYGYLGKYQFGRKTLNAIDMKHISNRQFLSSPELQEEAMQRLMLANYKSLKRYIKKYNGTTVHGILITKSGVLAAAHLGGAGNVKKWFRRGIEFKDGNGTKITSYMKQFGGYNLDI
ncbi:peptidoglycan-binding protein LysM [bacterium]|nr:peptidoglycan-binding protein LysM [bacterium]